MRDAAGSSGVNQVGGGAQPVETAPCSAIVLAGGKSRRLGMDKALLQVGGQTLIELAVRKLAALSDDVLVVTNDSRRFEEMGLPARYVADERRGVGSLMGVYSGLKAARHSHALAVACDMPFLNLPLLRYMISLSSDHDVVIPHVGGYYEPLHAIYSKACLPPMAELLARNRRQIIAFFPQVRVRHVTGQEIDRYDPQRLCFVNVNTPEDWARVKATSEADRERAAN
jgi:molybdopterin-guanine dinucleotide biosynthesis protein A